MTWIKLLTFCADYYANCKSYGEMYIFRGVGVRLYTFPRDKDGGNDGVCKLTQPRHRILWQL